MCECAARCVGICLGQDEASGFSRRRRPLESWRLVAAVASAVFGNRAALQAAARKRERRIRLGPGGCYGFWRIVVATSGKEWGSEKESEQQENAQHEAGLVGDICGWGYRFAEMHRLRLVCNSQSSPRDLA